MGKGVETVPVKGVLLYEGKAKKVFRTDDPDCYWVEFKDDATAFDGKKKGSINGKGAYNARISALLFTYLAREKVPTHFLELLNEREMLVRPLEILPVEVVARNVIAGSLAQRLGREEGEPLSRPVLEFYYKSDALGDPMINEYHIDALELATPQEMEVVKGLALKINRLLSERMRRASLELVDFKLEFGRYQGNILLGDEISPDTCRLWDVQTQEKLDKDRFRRDLGQVEEAYQEVWRRLQSTE